MMTEINKATAAARKKNLMLRPIALLWVQGESDANAKDAPLYQQRLREMTVAVREQLHSPELKILVAVNTRFQEERNRFMPAIIQAQQDFAAADQFASYVDTSTASMASAAFHAHPPCVDYVVRIAASLKQSGRVFRQLVIGFDTNHRLQLSLNYRGLKRRRRKFSSDDR
jgi:hypothetical protein